MDTDYSPPDPGNSAPESWTADLTDDEERDVMSLVEAEISKANEEAA